MKIEGAPSPGKKLGTMQVIDATTGEVIEEKQNAFTLLAPPPNVCQECVVNHPREHPHNAQSQFYQYHFYSTHGRFPTWTDAMRHCTPEMQADVRQTLIETYQRHKLSVPDDLMEPKPTGR
jgi:hypothetical protein